MSQPFSKCDQFEYFGALKKKVAQEIEQLDNAKILRASPTELEDSYLKAYIVSPLILRSEEWGIKDTLSGQVQSYDRWEKKSFPVQGTRFKIEVPFDGDPELWGVHPNSYGSSYPDINIQNGCIVLSYEFVDGSEDSHGLKTRIERDISALRSAVTDLQSNVETYNQELKVLVPRSIEGKIKNAQSSLNFMNSLGIPMHRVSAPETYAIPMQRRKIPVTLPRLSDGGYKPEPTLDLENYNFILKTISSMALVIERAPKAFCTLDEEDIRMHFLLALNSHYEGSATGETFNNNGKTDILIRVEDKNIFIAECKFWRGKKSFQKAISQILSYLTWRDSKCALLIFNKRKDSTAVKENMHEAMISSPEYKRTISSPLEGANRYLFVKNDDPGKEILVSTMLFDVPSSGPGSETISEDS